MPVWSIDELSRITAADELKILSQRSDSTLRKPVTIWVVRIGDDLYVRSVNGRESGWFHGTQVRHEGQIQSGGVTKDVRFVEAHPGIIAQVDAAYRSKYHRYNPRYIDPLMTAEARAATLKLVPISN